MSDRKIIEEAISHLRELDLIRGNTAVAQRICKAIVELEAQLRSMKGMSHEHANRR